MIYAHVRFLELGDWAVVQGRVDYAFIRYISVPSGAGAHTRGRWTAEIRYRYVYADQSHVNNRVAILDFVPIPREFADLDTGSVISVFVNPDDPSESLLTREYPAPAMVSVGFFAVLAAMFGFWTNQIAAFLWEAILGKHGRRLE